MAIAGSILPNLGILHNSRLQAVGEYYLHIRQNLMALPGVRLEDIEEVHSHPMALLQCVDFLDPHGWKLVEGRSNRRYTDETAVAQIVSGTGHDPYEHKLLGITAMEKLLGKKQFATLLSDLVERPQGKPVLVPASDKRPEMTNAKNDFANN